MHTTILPADNFIVINKTILNSYDYKLLLNLYQPIIGGIAVNLYFTLWSYLDKSEICSLEWTYHHLMSNTHLNLDEIIKAREKLEGIGLIKTYLKKSSINMYIFELYSPLNAFEFFNNPILSMSLLSNIGNNEYEKMLNYYKLPNFNFKEYENITLSFSDVYGSIDKKNLQNYDNIKTKNKNNIIIEEKINLNEILSLIPEEMLNTKLITKEIRENISKLAYIYNFSNEQMHELIINSLNEKRKIDLELLKSNCQRYYKFENSGTLPTIIYKKQPEYLRKNVTNTSKKAKVIYQFENLSPFEYLVSKNGGVKPSNSDLNLVSYLMVELNMMPGVVNVLLDYVLKINDNKLNRSFVEAIASQWLRNNIKTVSEAMELAEKEYKKKNKIVETKVKVKKESVKPDWFEKNIDTSEASIEEQEEIEKLLSEFK